MKTNIASRRRLIRPALLIAILCICSIGLSAQITPEFLIERIEVRNVKRASPEIVRSESHLREGQSYTERELRDAESRVRRLPFVLDVEFSLEKGGVRDAHILVMTVDEVSPFFVGIERVSYGSRGQTFTSGFTSVNGGVRWFVGDYGQLHASLDTYDVPDGAERGTLGYTHYNLFDRNVLLSFSVSKWSRTSSDEWDPALVLGMPLRGNHALRLTATGYERHEESAVPPFETAAGEASLSWIYDSTNDALFPTDGLTSSAELWGSRASHNGVVFDPPEGVPPGAVKLKFEAEALRLAVRKYWPVRTLDSAFFDVTALTFEESTREFGVSVRENAWDALIAQGSYSGSFWGIEKTRRYGDLRYEVGLRGRLERGTILNVPGIELQSAELSLVTGLALRNRWALLRFTLDWVVERDQRVERR